MNINYKNYGLLEIMRIGTSNQFTKRIVSKAKGADALKAFYPKLGATNAQYRYMILDMSTRKEVTKQELQAAGLN